MSTMPGSTLAASALAFSEPVPVFAPPEPPALDPPFAPLPPPKDGSGFGFPFALPPGFACGPFPLNGETAAGLFVWLSETAMPAPAAAATTATAT